ncbi:DUF2075 domain-containing protein, partial [Miniimonas arenae]
GPDLVWRGEARGGAGGWVAQREGSKDPAFRSRTAVGGEEFDRLVRHVYKVLLTRGLKGTVLYSTDAETRAMLRGLVGPR